MYAGSLPSRTGLTRKRVLVTGGAGLVGWHLCERLIAEGLDVVCADNDRAGRKDKIAHLLGNPQAEDCRGNVKPLGPRVCYDEGKLATETLSFDDRRQYATRIKVVRIFDTNRPRKHANDGRVVPDFIIHARPGQPVTLYADGSRPARSAASATWLTACSG